MQRSPAPDVRPDPKLRWWVELLVVFLCYELYSLARNTQGSNSTSATHAYRNARSLLHLERVLHLDFEPEVQRWFLHAPSVVKGLNIFYGSAHFIVTIAVLVWLFVKRPGTYKLWRWMLAATTGLALIGFATFPLLPPRLLPIEERTALLRSADPTLSEAAATERAETEVEAGTYVSPTYHFEDTLHTIGGLWSFESGPVAKLSNQYAAMPSLHFGWSLWVCLALWSGLATAAREGRRRLGRAVAVAHPVVTLIAIVATGNHYILDAVGGAATFAAGAVLAVLIVRKTTA